MKKLLVMMGACIVLANSVISCTVEEPAAAALMMGRTSQSLVFLDCKSSGEDEFRFSFSREVKLKSLNFEPAVKIDSVEDGSTVIVKLQENLPPGKPYLADIVAEDEQKNTINVLVQLKSRNNRMPRLVINEIRTENTKPKCEFIEFYLTSPGNLGGMRVVVLGNTNATKETVYEFSSCEVKQGEYLTLNLRTPEEGCKDELGISIEESGGANSSPASRDFWIPGNTKLIQKTGAVFVLDQDDNVLAAAMFSETPDAWWKRTEHAEAAEFLFTKGAWTAPDGKICTPAQAISTATTTNTRTICRDESAENTRTAQDWYVTVSSGNTPGRTNNPNRYNP